MLIHTAPRTWQAGLSLNIAISSLLILLVGQLGFTTQALAAQTIIQDEPLTTRSENTARPNLLFILDDSGSMAFDYMPDTMSSSSKYGFRSAQCNGVAYDPDTVYSPPVTATGTNMANSSFVSAWSDGFAQSGATNLDFSTSTTVDFSTSNIAMGTGSKTFAFTGSGYSNTTFTIGETLIITAGGSRSMTGTVTNWSATSWNSNGTKTLVVNVTSSNSNDTRNSWTATRGTGSYYYKSTSTQPKMGWVYTSSGPVQNTFYLECMSDVGGAPGSGVFTKVVVRSTSAEAGNYANWYSYYRTRTLMMRTSVGSAFKTLNDTYRVGFSTINSSTDVTTGPGFHPIDFFAGAQKTSIYSKLYGAAASGGTPLRGALSKAGRYFAKQFSGQTDPVQYSCQRNYALLSTDGYWNSGGDGVENNTTYGALDLNGNMVGNQDGQASRPMFDGTVTSEVTTKQKYVIGSLGSCRVGSSNRYQVISQTQKFTNGNWIDSGGATTSCLRANDVVVDGKTASDLRNQTYYTQPTTNTVVTGGSSNTLADVAAYYYNTDLRTEALNNCSSDSSGTAQSVCSNVLKPAGLDTATHQHMTTYTIGLGVSGTLAYDPNYLNQTSGDYVNLKSGAVDWPVPTTNISGNSGDARNIDDLWHAAVNGRGQYYSASNSKQLGEAISGVVNAITQQTGSASAASTSALELIAGDNNQVFQASYTTKTWIGDLKAFTLNGDTAEIGATPLWSAQTQLTQNTAASERKIYYKQPTSATRREFNWTNLNADGLGANFSGLCAKSQRATQCDNLSAAEKTVAETGSNLVGYLRGTRTYETASSANSTTRALYRARTGVLGDIINGAPVYVSKPPFSYTDAGYAAFVTAKRSRKPMVYVAANDGMLHAFSAASADGGTEMWAYIPNAVMPEMYRLADSGYEARHRYFVDGAPVVADIQVGTEWKTILVGGLNKGGRSYYALDVTDPANPLPLWEFTDTNLGLTYGNPVVAKRGNGTWVVVFGSGYNNDVDGGDGKGRLFVLNANTGEKLLGIATTAGAVDSPSGLAKINAWVDDPANNTSKRYYGGDLQGNLWRFDVDDLVEPRHSALLLATFQVDATTPQAITTRPETVEIAGKPVIVVGTGRYLNTDDINSTTQATQTIYAVKDNLTSTGLGNVRADSNMVRQTFTVTGDSASITNNPVDWNSKNGWWVDLPHSGERVVTDIALQFGTLSVATAIPSGDACSSGGKSWRYYLNAANGNSLEDPAGQLWSDTALIVGQSWVKLENGETRILRQSSDGSIKIERPPGGGGAAGLPHRTSWRELAD